MKRAGQYAEAVVVVERAVPGFTQAIAPLNTAQRKQHAAMSGGSAPLHDLSTASASAQDWAKAHPQGQTKKHQSNQDLNKGATLHLSTVDGRAAESGASIRTQKMADKVAKEAPELAVKVAQILT